MLCCQPVFDRLHFLKCIDFPKVSLLMVAYFSKTFITAYSMPQPSLGWVIPYWKNFLALMRFFLYVQLRGHRIIIKLTHDQLIKDLLNQRQIAIRVGIKLFNKHVTVCFTDNQVVVSKKVHQVHGIDLLPVLAVNPAESVQQHKLILLGEDLSLYFTFSKAKGIS